MESKRRKILVIKLGALGDIFLALEAFHAIRARHPDAHLTLMTRGPFVGLARRMPWFDEVMVDTSPRFYEVWKWIELRRALRAGGYSLVYDLQCKDRTDMYFRLMGPGAPEWCGTARGCSHRRAHYHKEELPAVERRLRFLESVDVPRAGPPDLGWLSAPVDDLALPEKFVLLIPGCAPQHPHKRWPAAHFAELAGLLAERGLGAVAVGTEVDQKAIEEIRAIFPAVVNLAGKTDLARLAEVARRSMGVVGNDTGPNHIAAIVGAPTLVLMSGRSDPVRMIPHGPDVGWLRREHLEDLSPEEVNLSVRLRQT